MLHQPCDLHLLVRFNLCNRNQFDLLHNHKRQRHEQRRSRVHRVRDRRNNRHRVRDRYRHRRAHRGRYRHRQLRDDQKVV